jgi:hypothetical protein
MLIVSPPMPTIPLCPDDSWAGVVWTWVSPQNICGVREHGFPGAQVCEQREPAHLIG